MSQSCEVKNVNLKFALSLENSLKNVIILRYLNCIESCNAKQTRLKSLMWQQLL